MIAFDAPDDAVYHDFAPGVRLIRLNVPAGTGGGGIRQAGRRLLALRRAISAGHFGIVVSFLTKINVLTLLATRGLAIPVVVSERNNPRRQHASRAWRAMLALLYPRATAIVMQTERSKSCLPPSQRERAYVIPNPIMLTSALPPPSEEMRVTAVGRLEAQKGFDLLIDAFARIVDNRPDWRLVIWGNGPLRDELAAQAAQRGIGERVSFAGNSQMPGGWIKPSGIFVLSSRFEGFPNALGEAMAAGMAVIAFDCEFGPREFITSGVDGLLVPAEDVQALANALESLMCDSRRRAMLSSSAASSIRRFEHEIVCQKWLRLLDSV